MACEKSGKTIFLIDFMYRALRNRNRVVYFEAGDGDQDEVLLKLLCRSSGKPEYSGNYLSPLGWNGNGLQTKTQHLDAVDATAQTDLKRICKSPDALRVSSHPSSTLSVEQIDSLLNDWERNGWMPSTAIIDYADILAPNTSLKDKLDQIDTIWSDLRRLSQKRHLLVLTATQASASAYKEKGLLGRQHFSGRKTKLAHVNGMIGINVTEEERTNQTARLNWVVRRKMRNRGKRNYVTVAGCFDVGNPVIKSKR